MDGREGGQVRRRSYPDSIWTKSEGMANKGFSKPQAETHEGLTA